MNERAAFVYRMYDADDRLLYIGSSWCPSDRIKALTAPWNIGKPHVGELMRRFDHYTTERHPSRRAALDAERAAIRAEAPELNINSQAGGRRSLTRVGSEDDQ